MPNQGSATSNGEKPRFPARELEEKSVQSGGEMLSSGSANNEGGSKVVRVERFFWDV